MEAHVNQFLTKIIGRNQKKNRNSYIYLMNIRNVEYTFRLLRFM